MLRMHEEDGMDAWDSPRCLPRLLCSSLAAPVGKPALFSKRLKLVGGKVDGFPIAEEG